MNKVTIVIPNYNGKAYMDKCMKCLVAQEYKDFNVIVVDNASMDKSQNIALQYGKDLSVEIVQFSKNTGFSVAVNEGIRNARGEYVILLNNDAYADKAFVGELVNKMESDSKIFSAQALMLQENNKNLVDGAGDYFSAMGWAFARGKDKEAEYYTTDKDVFSCCAGAAIYRKSVFDEIGLFDENFFAYLEDMDVGYRARLKGYRNVIATKAKVYHVGSGSSGSRHNYFKAKISARNSFLVMYKNFAWWQWVVNMPLIVVGFLIKVIYFIPKRLTGGYVSGVFSSFGIMRKTKKAVPVNRKIRIKLELELLRNCFLRLCK